jgi:hypothetical protein
VVLEGSDDLGGVERCGEGRGWLTVISDEAGGSSVLPASESAVLRNGM